MSFRLDWNDQLRDRVRDGTIAATNDFDEAVAEAARHDHPGWQSRTGEAEQSIRAVPAQAVEDKVQGGVGFGVARGTFLEFKARGHAGDRTINRAMERLGDGLARRIRDEIQR